MQHTFGKEPCEGCKQVNAEYNRYFFNEMIDFINWRELWFFVILLLICYLTMGWIGIPIGLAVHWLSACLEGGAISDAFHDYPDEEPSEIKCVAGKKNCEICDKDGELKSSELEAR